MGASHNRPDHAKRKFTSRRYHSQPFEVESRRCLSSPLKETKEFSFLLVHHASVSLSDDVQSVLDPSVEENSCENDSIHSHRPCPVYRIPPLVVFSVRTMQDDSPIRALHEFARRKQVGGRLSARLPTNEVTA